MIESTINCVSFRENVTLVVVVMKEASIYNNKGVLFTMESNEKAHYQVVLRFDEEQMQMVKVVKEVEGEEIELRDIYKALDISYFEMIPVPYLKKDDNSAVFAILCDEEFYMKGIKVSAKTTFRNILNVPTAVQREVMGNFMVVKLRDSDVYYLTKEEYDWFNELMEREAVISETVFRK